ncbi:hypothetical protein N7478_009079 [Penicillium angulare]|uniref:uncharacterized protein n=1 Tax=Penicillium angulare TaxID=116970 RepID=UPI00253FC52F|nr:uncharacterized protein N7478_009079 [Penicillium angulare]KAJ5273954.1 hypothetical protein N7478_009079 [Penicillium angulare]
MRLNRIFAAWIGVAATPTLAIGLHKAVEGLLQVTPSFSGDDVVLHPGLRPDHDTLDLEHLMPRHDKSRSPPLAALHGAKHASLEGKFVRGTVVLDQSNHIKSVICDTDDIQVCFKNSSALQAAESSWARDGGFNLATYHVGCGDEGSGKRTFFHVSHTSFNNQTMCAVMTVTEISEEEALESAVLSWGTYTDPTNRKRSPTKGHVRVQRPGNSNHTLRGSNHTLPGRPMRTMNGTVIIGNPTEPPIINGTTDITTDPNAFHYFFNNSHLNTTDMGAKIPTMPFLDIDDYENENSKNVSRRSLMRSRHERTNRVRTELSTRSTSALARRDFFGDIWDGIIALGRAVVSAFRFAAGAVLSIGERVVELATITIKLLLVPFGVPFKHIYHHDISFHEYLNGASVSNKPPNIFGVGDGFVLAKPHGAEWTVQCTKCGVHVNMDIEGQLEFSIKDGLTEGFLQFRNKDELRLDAQIGISATGKLSRGWSDPIKHHDKELKNIPLPGFGIPGILTLGPQVSFSVSVALQVEGKIELLVGGSVILEPGTATASIVKAENGIHGFNPRFEPVFKASGQFTAGLDIGLPIGMDFGIDVLQGKFKKTVSFTNAPSIYAEATYALSNDETKKGSCNNGVQLKAGVRHRLYVNAVDLWEFDIANFKLYEKDLGCVTANGFTPGNVKNDNGVIKDIVDKAKGDSYNQKPFIPQVSVVPKKTYKDQAFRILMDSKGETIMVSGEDGGLYLVGKNQGYDTSAPWGTLDKKENPISLDVFGRVLAFKSLPRAVDYQDFKYQFAGYGQGIADLVVVDPTKVPDGYQATVFKPLPNSKAGCSRRYGIAYVGAHPNKNDGDFVFYPTACVTPTGLRIIMTTSMIDKEGQALDLFGHPSVLLEEIMKDDFLKHYGTAVCRTVQLVSDQDQQGCK